MRSESAASTFRSEELHRGSRLLNIEMMSSTLQPSISNATVVLSKKNVPNIVAVEIDFFDFRSGIVKDEKCITE